MCYENDIKKLLTLFLEQREKMSEEERNIILKTLKIAIMYERTDDVS